MLKQLAVAELTPGMLVTRVIEQAGPMKIRKVGMIRSPDMIKGLQEMGVIKVEVDLAQSLSVEFEGDETNERTTSNIYAPDYLESSNNTNSSPNSTAHANTETSKQTATQRLVATNKQVSDVDRQLSQQFHRSLFLPAVDQMPSKWTLYGKPYGYLLGFILLGLGIGWLGASVPQHFYAAPSTNNAPVNTDAESVLAINPDSESTVLDSLAADKSNSAQSSEELGGNGQTGARGSQTNAPEKETQAEVTPSTSSNNSSALATNESSTTPSTNPRNAPIDDADARQYESVNGVILESGQQVLGYRGSESEQDTQTSLQAQLEDTRQSQANQQEQVEASALAEDENPVITNAPGFTTITEPSVTNFNNDLLRRAQRAAEQVDRQPQGAPEPVLKVTDLNTLPRIDQLTPAILTQMPSMSFSAHMYASNPQDRWVRVNGRRLGEGEYITDGLLIKQIESEKVVLSFRDRDFTMNALTDW